MDPNIPNQPLQNEIPPVQPNPLSQPIIQQPVNQPPIQQNPIPQQPASDSTPSGSKWKLMLLIIILLTLLVGGGIYYFAIGKNKPTVQNKQKTIASINADVEISTTSKKLGEVPSSDYRDVIFSPNGTRSAYVIGGEGIDSSNYVVVDGNKSKLISDGMYGNASNLQFSPDSKHFAYWVEKEGGYDAAQKNYLSKKYFVIDGQEQNIDKTADPQSLVFSPDSQHYSYIINEAKSFWIILDGKQQGPYEEAYGFVFSPDSQHYDYVAKKDGKFFNVYDGKKQKEYFALYYPTFSPDSQHFAYLADDTGGQKEKLFLVLDNNEFRNYEYIGIINFSPDSQHVADFGSDGKSRFVIVDGKIESNFPPYILSGMVFSHNGDSVAYMAEDGERFAIVINGKKEESHDLVEGFSFSPDDKHYTYVAAEEKVSSGGGVMPSEELLYKKWFIVYDGKKSVDYGYARAPVFSPDSQHFAYRIVGKNGWTIVLDGKEGKAYKDKEIGAPLFSGDNQGLAYTNALGLDENMVLKYRLIINGKESKIYDQIYTVPKYNLNDNSWEYGVKSGNELLWISDKVGKI